MEDVCKKIRHCLSLRQRNGAWLGIQMGEGSEVMFKVRSLASGRRVIKQPHLAYQLLHNLQYNHKSHTQGMCEIETILRGF